ncbi:tachylectin-2 [Microcaecilia unicolor]|uniref:Tachylectin-2-like n=1 Tax=Microcaecilia unicolor TaxID=1415580 RepID=A0A6P7XIW4_9AMPH|nr:tachylectin-2-like [Microcaecilia unicolor]
MSEPGIILFAVDSDGHCKVGLPPANELDIFYDRCIDVGKLGNASHVFFSPDGQMYAVRGSELYAGPLIKSQSDNWWEKEAIRVGKTDWDKFSIIFFHPDGTLYATTKKGKFFKGPVPKNENVSWLYSQASEIGSNGWDAFLTLFFDPEGMLYAVLNNGKLLKRRPPTKLDPWYHTSEVIGDSGWKDLCHFISFSPDGNLWCVTQKDGKICTGKPPANAQVKWPESAKMLGWDYNRYKFISFTRDKTVQKLLNLDFLVDDGKILSVGKELLEEQVYENTSSIPLNASFSFTKTIKSESSFAHEHGFTIDVGAEMSFTTGIPIIEQMGVKITMNMSTTHTWNFNKINSTQSEFSRTSTFQVPPGKGIKQTAIIQRARMDVPYQAKVRTLFDYETTLCGTWKGASVYNLIVKQEDYVLD